MKWDGEKGSIRIYDLLFTWGSSKQGTKQLHDKGDKIDSKDSHLVQSSTPSATFKQILKNDYPGYKYT